MKSIPMRSALLLRALLIPCFLFSCAGQMPQVQQKGPSKQFFKDQVTYPFEVRYADARDGEGTTWQIGYMDVAPLFKTDPKVLVLIHGRGFSGAYFGHAARIARDHGIRVIVPDLPNYGKSIPGNMDKPMIRSLQQTREVIHDLLVNRLGIKQAVYGGHSLGGQWALGYALTYPQAVEKIILISPAGLEELPGGYFPAALSRSTAVEDFLGIPYYASKARLDHSKKAELIQDYYFYRLKINGRLVPSGFFKQETPDTLLATDIRVRMITGNPAEFARYSMTSTRDIYNLGVEIRKEDPNSLFKRYDRIRAPVLLVFGEKDPFYPKKISGLKDLKKEMIKPFYRRLTRAGCPVSVKLYPGSGHFPHNDMPEDFGRDLVRFVSAGEVEGEADPDIF